MDAILETCDFPAHYLEAVINGSLRKYLPGVMTDRVRNKEIELPPAIYQADDVFSKTWVHQLATILWTTSWSPVLQRSYDTFNPERFIDPDIEKNRKPCEFFSFAIFSPNVDLSHVQSRVCLSY